MLTQELVQELLDYDPDTGVLTWKKRGLHHFKNAHFMNAWNAKNAGKEAFTASTHKGYRHGAIKGVLHKKARVVYLWLHGWLPEQVDHADRDTANDRSLNLKASDPVRNMKNKGAYKNNTLGVPGVTIRPSGKYRARIGHEGKKIHLGDFDSLDKAVEARNLARAKYGYIGADHE